ncbi:hypothetical protein H4R34_004795, partial [Dimargaris verticillata]
MAHFIRNRLMGNIPLPDERFKTLAQKFVEERFKTEETDGTMGVAKLVLSNKRNPKKEFNYVVYSQGLKHFFKISRGTMDERIHDIIESLHQQEEQ